MKSSDRRKQIVKALCQAYVKIEQPRKAERWCEDLLTMKDSAEDPDGLVGRGEARMAKEEWEDAVRAFEKAFEATGKSSQDVRFLFCFDILPYSYSCCIHRQILSRLQKAQKLLKQSRSKDYYKVLGVARDADERTIKKA